jgi:phosphoribosyl 1,2-cyclic phosphodiesterase
MPGAATRSCALRSGSSGNAIFVGSGRTRLLVDAGVCCRTIEQSLQEIGETAADLDGILVTHEHIDHIAGVGILMRRHRIHLYVNLATWQAMRPVIGPVDEKLIHLVEAGRPTAVGDLALTAFATPHDAVSPVGYRIETRQGSVAVFTDIGSLQEHLFDQISGCRTVYIEANYDHAMLMAGSYPAMLKQRIAGSQGHLSNDDCATAVCRLLNEGTSHFVLSHISKDNNFPELALLTVNSRLQASGACADKDLYLGIARRFAVSEPVCF